MATIASKQVLAASPADKTRTDEEARERISLALRKSPYYALRGISCSVHNGQPMLWGTVTSYYYKQIAQAIARNALDGRQTIKNQIEVLNADERS